MGRSIVAEILLFIAAAALFFFCLFFIGLLLRLSYDEALIATLAGCAIAGIADRMRRRQ